MAVDDTSSAKHTRHSYSGFRKRMAGERRCNFVIYKRVDVSMMLMYCASDVVEYDRRTSELSKQHST